MKLCAIDTETVSLEDKTLVGFSIAEKKNGKLITRYFPVRDKVLDNYPLDDARKILQSYVNNYKCVFHNSSFDLVVLEQFGINTKDIDVEDSLILANIYDENVRHGLKGLTKRYFHYHMIEFKEICGTGKKQIPFSESEHPDKYKYAADDAYWTYKLWEFLLQGMQSRQSELNLYYTIEKPLFTIIAQMHKDGITIDVARVKELKELFERKMELAGDKIKHIMGDVNLNSPKQLREYFIDGKNMPVLKRSKRTNEPSVDKEVLKTYSESCIEAELILEYRKYAKLYSTFIPAMTPKDFNVGTMLGNVYPTFRQAGTVSGRFSSSSPNFQNIPHEDELGLRSCVVAEKGHKLVGCDFSQIELRVLAHFSQDFNLMKAYKENKDIHQQTADACGIERYNAKTINFGIVYGMGAGTLGKRLEVGYDEAQNYIERYFHNYPGVKEWWDNTEQHIKDFGFTETLFGRKRHVTNKFYSKDDYEQGCEIRSLINAVIQGTAAEIMKLAMINMAPKLAQIGARIVSTVHDEVIVTAPESKAKQAYKIVSNAMVEAGEKLTVPVTVDGAIGKTWEEIH